MSGVAEGPSPLRLVLAEDLETLRRLPLEERIALFNRLRESYERYLSEVMPTISDSEEEVKLDREIRGRFQLAMLLLAATFKVNGENVPEITGRFSEEEYRIILDLEELKILDLLDENEIVRLIERREGRVYEVVKKYYERQYYLLDTSWGKLMGNLALALNERYARRRRKLEDAVVAYLRKRSLAIFMGEIEDAVTRALEARRAREEAQRLARRIEEEMRRIEALAGGFRFSESVEAELAAVERALETAEGLRPVLDALERARRALEEKEEELRALATKYREAKAAEEVLSLEARKMREQLEQLQARAREYEALVAAIRAERDALRERLESLEAAVKGGTSGHLVTAEEAWALEESLVRRILRKMEREARVYDPRRGETRRVSWDRRAFYQAELEGRPRGLGVELASYRGVLRKRLDIVVDAGMIVHPKAYKEKGYDSAPVSLGDLMEHLEPRLRRASEEDYYAIIIVGSPTGFSGKAIEYVTSRSIPGLAPERATIYLVDPVAGRVYYNEGDPAAEANKGLAEPWLDEERVSRAVAYLRGDEARRRAVLNSSASPFLTSREVAEATGLDLETIRRAFHILEEKGVGRVAVVNGVAAFIYKWGGPAG